MKLTDKDIIIIKKMEVKLSSVVYGNENKERTSVCDRPIRMTKKKQLKN